ncbi:hypothetical protein IVB36_28005 [Bradyrhizobium sp. 35]|uniref:hypothetical protein n=1 Tax=Bradyrhizobium sp. 35 TaxID=2782670 RepID=UPI001FF8AC26|nr:hypothetical protein [Bradyrhizobium sp. 35]MCK1454603.1 hypothetical protein [Bradyrhizobium sp. 35]
MVYATAARQAVQINFDQRAAELAAAPMPGAAEGDPVGVDETVTFGAQGPHRQLDVAPAPCRADKRCRLL